MKWLDHLWASVQAILHISLTISSSSSSTSLFQTQVQQQQQQQQQKQQQQQQRHVQCSEATKKPPNFLLIGNSYANNLAPALQSILVDANIPEWSDPATSTTLVNIQSVNPGGFTFPRHLGDYLGGGGLATLLSPTLPAESAYQFVVLQDQSQVPGFVEFDSIGGEFFNSVQAAKELDQIIANSAQGSGAQTMFFMTWGRRDVDGNNPTVFPNFSVMQDKLTEGYMRFVQETSTPERPTFVAPVGLVFQTIFEDGSLFNTEGVTLFAALYSGDGSHPSALGTYVAALTIYTSMTGWNPNNINWLGGIDATNAKAVQEAVARTIASTYESNFIIYPWQATPPDWLSSPTESTTTTTTTVVEESTVTTTPVPTATPILQTQPPTAPPQTQQPTGATPVLVATVQPTVRFVLPSLVNSTEVSLVNSTEAPFTNTTNSSSISTETSLVNSTEAPFTNTTNSSSSLSFTMPSSNITTSILRGPLTAAPNKSQSTVPPNSTTSVPHSTDDSIGAVTDSSSFQGLEEEGLEGPSLTNVLSAGTRTYSYGMALLMTESLVLVLVFC